MTAWYPGQHTKLSALLEFFVVKHSGDIPTTKLVKLTYLADLLAFCDLGRQITEVTYISYDHGPWSRDFHDALDANENLRARHSRNFFGAPAVYYEFCGDKPNLQVLDNDEIGILKEIDEEWGSRRLKDILEQVYSHEPFKSAEFGEEIDLSRIKREPDFPRLTLF